MKTEIVSKGDVEKDSSALASVKETSADIHKLEVLRHAWVATDEGRSLVLQQMQSEY